MFGVLWWVFSILNKPLQLPLLDEGFNLLLKVVAFGVIVLVVLVETTVLVPGPFAWIALQLVWPCQCRVVL